MGFFSTYPQEYLNKNTSVQKQLNVIFDMEGASDEIFSLAPTLKTLIWGDPNVYYGDAGLVWGGKIKDGQTREFILSESNLQISQQVEPEQGRGSVSTMSFVFVDLDGEVTNFFSPGQVVNEPLGNKLVRVRIGYSDTAYPQDYFTVFRGYVSSVRSTPTKISVQLSDPNSKTRGQLFYTPKTTLTSSIGATDTTLPVVDTADFAQQIIGPNGSYDSGITTYAKVGDEYVKYGPSPSDITVNSITNVVRGQRDTPATNHDIDSDVAGAFQIFDNFLNIALKVMLSGWDGYWKTDVPIFMIRQTTDGDVLNALQLPFPVDAIEDYGLSVGDYVTIFDSAAGNNGTYIISGIASVDELSNNLILFETDFPSIEDGTDGVNMSFRSKYDVYPINLGMKLTPADIDVSVYEYFRDVFFQANEYHMNFLLDAPISGKQWIESQLFLPAGCYSITRKGKLAVNLTLPPIGASNVQTLDHTNILDPKSITIERAINTRRYFNEIQYQYDKNDAGEYLNTRIVIDSLSLSNITISTVLPIAADGVRTNLDADVLVDRQGQLLIQRYKNAALYLECQVNWRVGSLIETGDTVILNDNGQLHISNFATGTRNLGSVLFEVIKCTKDVKGGKVSLGLLSGLSYLTTDRFGSVTPTSNINPAQSTTASIKIVPSFGDLYGAAEYRKWTDAVGYHVAIHPTDYSQYYETKLVSAGPNNVLMLNPPLPVVPSDNWVIDIAYYPTDTDIVTDRYLKQVYCHFTYDIVVASDVSTSQFTVNASDAYAFRVGNPIYYHSYDYSTLSSETTISGVSGNLISVEPSFDVIPSDGGRVGLIGYLDGGQPYRYV